MTVSNLFRWSPKLTEVDPEVVKIEDSLEALLDPVIRTMIMCATLEHSSKMMFHHVIIVVKALDKTFTKKPTLTCLLLNRQDHTVQTQITVVARVTICNRHSAWIKVRAHTTCSRLTPKENF